VDYCVNKAMEFLMESTIRHHHRNVLRALCTVSKVLGCGIHEMDTAIHTSSPTMFISETLYQMLWDILHMYLC